MERKSLIYLFLIVILGAALRFSYLTFNPPSLNWDEVSHGYNAYSILKTGRDEWGKFFPITNFRAYGDYPLPLNLYLTIPFILILGLNEFSIRFPHAILGILTVVASYFLAMGLTKRRNVSVLATLLVAIEPWYIFTSRFVLQSNLSVFFLTAGAAAFVNRGKHRFLLPLSLLLFGLTLFSYHSTRIFTPLFMVAIFFIYKKELVSSFFSILVILIFFLPMPFILLNPEARARSNVVFLLDQGATNRIIEARNSSKFPPVVTNLIYNRPVYFVGRFFKNYFEYFSPDFLFLKGGTQYQFSVPNYGLLFLINLPFFYLGLILVAKGALRKNKEYILMFTWLLLSPIPASITNESFAVVRATTMLPLPQILVALGFLTTRDFLVKRFIWIKGAFLPIYLILLAVFLENYLTNYFTSYRTAYSWSWQYGYKEAVDYAKANYDKYDKIIVTKKYGEPHEFFLFFWPWDPEKYRSDPNLVRFYQSNWYWVDRFDKFNFVNDWQIPKNGQTFVLESKNKVECGKAKCLLVTSPSNYPKGWNKLKTINFLDGKTAFETYEN